MERSQIHILQAGLDHETVWDNYVSSHTSGIAYQFFAWKKTMETAYHLKTTYLMATRKDTVVGVFPLAVAGFPFSRPCLVSLPYCDAAGPLADSKDIREKLLESARRLMPNREIRAVDPFLHSDPETIVHKEKVRMLLKIPPSSDKLWNSLKSKVRSQVRKAEKNGLTVQMGQKNLLNDFYEIFCENMRDLGSIPHSFSWFSSLIRFMGDHAKICVVYTRDHLPAAAGLILCHPKLVSIPWASSLRRYNPTNANMLLYWTLLEFTAKKQYPVFDFGRSTKGEGTFLFKKQWGANPAPLYWAFFQNKSKSPILPPGQTSGQLRSVAENLLSKIPTSTSKALGTMVRKYITL